MRAARELGRQGAEGVTRIQTVRELICKEECFKLLEFCMEIHRKLGKGCDEIVCKDAARGGTGPGANPILPREGIRNSPQGRAAAPPLPADFVIWDKLLFGAKSVEALTDSHVKQVLNFLAAAKFRLGLLVNFGAGFLEWRRVIL